MQHAVNLKTVKTIKTSPTYSLFPR